MAQFFLNKIIERFRELEKFCIGELLGEAQEDYLTFEPTKDDKVIITLNMLNMNSRHYGKGRQKAEELKVVLEEAGFKGVEVTYQQVSRKNPNIVHTKSRPGRNPNQPLITMTVDISYDTANKLISALKIAVKRAAAARLKEAKSFANDITNRVGGGRSDYLEALALAGLRPL